MSRTVKGYILIATAVLPFRILLQTLVRVGVTFGIDIGDDFLPPPRPPCLGSNPRRFLCRYGLLRLRCGHTVLLRSRHQHQPLGGVLN